VVCSSPSASAATTVAGAIRTRRRARKSAFLMAVSSDVESSFDPAGL